MRTAEPVKPKIVSACALSPAHAVFITTAKPN